MLIGFILLQVTLGSAYADLLELATFRTHSRLTFQLDEGVETSIKNSSQGFDLHFKGIGINDLGAPLGEETKWAKKFAQLNDPRLASLQFIETPDGVTVRGAWKYPAGKSAPAHPEMEAFDYWDKEQVQYIFDFWPKEGKTVAEVKKIEQQYRSKATKNKSQKLGLDLAHARQLRLEAERESQDISRFCRKPFGETTDLFVPFLPAKPTLDFGKWFSTTTPDSKFIYFMPPTHERQPRVLASEEEKQKTDEASYVRLALSLYAKGKNALVLRTLDFFSADYPRSVYRNEMKFLRANALIKIGMATEAEKILTNLLSEAKEAPVALHAGMYLAAKRYKEGSHLASLELFMWLIANHPEHRLSWVFHLGAAESLASLKQTERAAKEFQWIVEHAKDKKTRALASSRIGDLYLERFNYESALASYFQTYNYMKPESNQIPDLMLNRGEVLYQLTQYDRAQDEFEKFLEYFPTHPDGWRATFRLAEIQGRKSPRQSNKKSYDWLLDTINRYPFSPGAVLARMNLFSCETKESNFAIHKQVERFFENEVPSYMNKQTSSEVLGSAFKNFEALARVRAFARFLPEAGRSEKAIDTAVSVLDDPTHHQIAPMVSEIFMTVFRKHILEEIDNDQGFKAVQYFSKHAQKVEKWVGKTQAPIDFILKLSQAASNLGLSKTALDLAAVFKDYSSKVAERKLASQSADQKNLIKDDLDEQIKLADLNFSEAKANWIAYLQGQKSENKPKLDKDRLVTLLNSVTEESSHFFEKNIILAQIQESEGKLEQVIANVSRAQLILKKGLAKERLSGWLIDLYRKSGSLSQAYDLATRLESQMRITKMQLDSKRDVDNEKLTLLGTPIALSLEQVILLEAQIQEQQGRWGQAAATYDRAAGAGLSENQALYGKARALLKSGIQKDYALAIEYLEKLSANSSKVPEGKDGFWSKLARETLANEKVKNEVRPRRANQ